MAYIGDLTDEIRQVDVIRNDFASGKRKDYHEMLIEIFGILPEIDEDEDEF